MSATHVHRQIEALQQQVAALRAAMASPAQGQGVLL
jgi:prefoldin subunit 5